MASTGRSPRKPPLRVLSGGQAPSQVVDLYEEAYAELCRFLQRKIGNRHDAEDIAQEAFERMWKASENNRISDLRGYLFTTASHLALNHVRHSKVVGRHRVSELARRAEPGPGPERVLAGRDRLDRAWEVIAGLPEKTCHVFLMHRFAGFTYPEIAKHLGLSKKSVEYHMKLALGAIATALHASTEGFE